MVLIALGLIEHKYDDEGQPLYRQSFPVVAATEELRQRICAAVVYAGGTAEIGEIAREVFYTDEPTRAQMMAVENGLQTLLAEGVIQPGKAPPKDAPRFQLPRAESSP